MRATRWSLLVAAVALVAACSSGSVEVSMPEPPPATPTAEVTEPAVAEAVTEAPAAPAAPEVVAQLPAPAPDEEVVATEDDPIPLGAAPRAAAPRAGAPAGGVQTAHAQPAGKAQPTGRIEIPAIGLNHLTYEGIDLATINYGPSHWPGTPLPGQLGNTVFPGHRTTYSRPFWDMDKLVPGNEVIFSNAAGRFTYRIDRVFIVNANETWIVNNTPDATFTIMACHPKGSAKQRIVAKGTMVNQPKPQAPPQAAPTPTTRQKLLGIL